MKKSPHINALVETLRETLEEIPVAQAEVARATGIPSPHLSAMKTGKRRVTPEYDLRLSRYLGTTPGFWLRLQLASDLRKAQADKSREIRKQVKPLEAA